MPFLRILPALLFALVTLALPAVPILEDAQHYSNVCFAIVAGVMFLFALLVAIIATPNLGKC